MRYEISKLEEQNTSYMCNEDLVRLIVDKPAKEIMEASNYSLRNLNKMSIEDLTKVPGVGKIKAAQIIAAMELGRRCYKEKAQEITNLGDALSIYNYMKPNLDHLEHEEFWILVMNNKFNLVKAKRMSSGGLTEVVADIRLIMKEVFLSNGTVLAMVHNHPSGSISPSKNDKLITSQIKKACEMMRIIFLDHVIVGCGADSYYSFQEDGNI